MDMMPDRPHDGRRRGRALQSGVRASSRRDQLMDEALKAAARIASLSPVAAAMAKEAVNRAVRDARWPKACAPSGRCSCRCSGRPTSARGWRPSSRSASRTSGG